MKKLVLIAAFFTLCFFGANAQITQVSQNDSFGWGYTSGIYPFQHAGIKIVYHDLTGDPIRIYNLNNTLYKTITPPVFGDFTFLSEDLFDNDPTTFEYVLQYQDNNYVPHTRIYREDGTLLFSGDTLALSWTNGYGSGISPIFNTDSGTFMSLQKYTNGNWSISPPYQVLYKLPGTLFCPACDGSNFPATHITGIRNPGNGSNMELRAFPNPSNNKTKIYYSLPEGVLEGDLILFDLLSQEKKRIRVNRYSPFIEVSTSDIAAGNYFYRIETSKGISQGKQQVVVH
ncbi:MAG: T9SS type A sorting domain-containing protein [Bacteroidota bacterium]